MDIISRLEVTFSHTSLYTFISIQKNESFGKEALFIPPAKLPPIVYLDGKKIHGVDIEAWAKEKYQNNQALLSE